MDVGERIRVRRKDLGMTQKQLHLESGVAEISIRQYESGKRTPQTEQLSQLAKALKTTTSYLLGEINHAPLVESKVELGERVKEAVHAVINRAASGELTLPYQQKELKSLCMRLDNGNLTQNDLLVIQNLLDANHPIVPSDALPDNIKSLLTETEAYLQSVDAQIQQSNEEVDSERTKTLNTLYGGEPDGWIETYLAILEKSPTVDPDVIDIIAMFKGASREEIKKARTILSTLLEKNGDTNGEEKE